MNKRERILALDLLRGYFLAVMIVDHLVFFPSFFEFLSGRGSLWASAAEGFFIISGILVGYVFGPRMEHNALAAAKKMWRRAASLYVWAVGLTWFTVVWAHLAHSPHIKNGLWQLPPLGEFFYKTLTLQYSYGWADFLQYYVVFLVFAPVALYLCTRGRGRLVVTISAFLWCLRGTNFVIAWQLLFMGGLVAGYYLPAIERTVRSWSPRTQRALTLSVYGTALGTIIVSALTVRASLMYFSLLRDGWPLPSFLTTIMTELDQFRILSTPWIDKWTLAPVRVAIAPLWFCALYMFVRKRERWIDNYTNGFLRTLGQQSLFVYGLHALVIFGMTLAFPHSLGILWNTIYTALVLGAIYAITRYRHNSLVRRAQGRSIHMPRAPQTSAVAQQ